jgi:hypothetical protein
MNDYGSPPPLEPEDQGQWLTDVIRTVQTPAAALQWYGICSLVLSALVITIFLAAPDTICDWYYKQMIQLQKDEAPENRKPLPPYRQFVQTQQIQMVVGHGISLACGFLIAFGGVRMRQLNGYGWAVTGSILSAIPCTNSCCCVGTPIGLWALVTLFGSDVRLAFARVGALGGLEAYTDGPLRDDPPSRPIRLE